MALPEISDEKEKAKSLSLSKSVSNEKTPGSEKIDVCYLFISFEMGCMTAKLRRSVGREYRMGKDTVVYNTADLNSDPDFDSDIDEINHDIQKPPLVTELSCHPSLRIHFFANPQ